MFISGRDEREKKMSDDPHLPFQNSIMPPPAVIY
jgi:hypothetical protein